MNRNEAARDRPKSDGRGLFEKFVEAVNQLVSRAPFFIVCLAIVLLWLLSFPLWHSLDSWQVAIHTVSSVISLLLLVVLQNSGRRSEEAGQEKLNVIADALSDVMESRAVEDTGLTDSVRRLREAVGLEERH